MVGNQYANKIAQLNFANKGLFQFRLSQAIGKQGKLIYEMGLIFQCDWMPPTMVASNLFLMAAKFCKDCAIGL